MLSLDGRFQGAVTACATLTCYQVDADVSIQRTVLWSIALLPNRKSRILCAGDHHRSRGMRAWFAAQEVPTEQGAKQACDRLSVEADAMDSWQIKTFCSGPLLLWRKSGDRNIRESADWNVRDMRHPSWTNAAPRVARNVPLDVDHACASWRFFVCLLNGGGLLIRDYAV